jgi:hypothetical protein
MISEGSKRWQLYATWVCMIISFALFVMGEKQRSGKR